jgi:hypothetical protein
MRIAQVYRPGTMTPARQWPAAINRPMTSRSCPAMTAARSSPRRRRTAIHDAVHKMPPDPGAFTNECGQLRTTLCWFLPVRRCGMGPAETAPDPRQHHRTADWAH